MHIVIKSASSAPYANPYLGGGKPLYQPPIPKRAEARRMALGRARLGVGPNFDMTTLIAGLGGAAAVVGSRWTDQPVKALLNVAGIAALGFAAYRAFLDVPAEAAVKKPGEAAKPAPAPVSVPVGSLPAYESVTGIISSPRQGSEMEVETGFFSIQATYPASIVLSNSSGEAVPVQYRLYASEKPAYFGRRSSGANQGEVAQGQILLAPGRDQTVSLTLKPVTAAAITASSIEVTLTLQKRASERAAWQTLSTVVFTLQ